MADPLKEPLDIDELFKPFENPTPVKATDTRDTTIGKVVSSAYKEGRLGTPATLLGGGAIAYGAKKGWDKSVQTSLKMLKEAATKEAEAVELAQKAGYKAGGATLNKPLVGVMPNATSRGMYGLPTSEAEQLAMARRLSVSRLGRPFGLGGYADYTLDPKVSLTPKIIRQARAGEPTLGLTTLAEAEGPSAIIPARDVPKFTSAPLIQTREHNTLTPFYEAEAAAANLPANAWQRGARGLYNMQFGNAGIPLNTAGAVGKSLFKSGLGWGALTEGVTAAYDTWPTFLGGSGNNVYGRTRDELRSGGIDPSNTFNYDIMPAIGGGLATIGRIGTGVGANALTLGLYRLGEEAFDIDKQIKAQQKAYESDFAKNPAKFDPENLERVRLRMIASGMISPDSIQYNTRENTPEKVAEYKKKVEALKNSKK